MADQVSHAILEPILPVRRVVSALPYEARRRPKVALVVALKEIRIPPTTPRLSSSAGPLFRPFVHYLGGSRSFNLAINFRSDQDHQSCDVEPRQQNDDGAE